MILIDSFKNCQQSVKMLKTKSYFTEGWHWCTAKEPNVFLAKTQCSFGKMWTNDNKSAKKARNLTARKFARKNAKTLTPKHLGKNWRKFIAPILRINALLAKHNQTTISGFLINNKGAKFKGAKIARRHENVKNFWKKNLMQVHRANFKIQ